MRQCFLRGLVDQLARSDQVSRNRLRDRLGQRQEFGPDRAVQVRCDNLIWQGRTRWRRRPTGTLPLGGTVPPLLASAPVATLALPLVEATPVVATRPLGTVAPEAAFTTVITLETALTTVSATETALTTVITLETTLTTVSTTEATLTASALTVTIPTGTTTLATASVAFPLA